MADTYIQFRADEGDKKEAAASLAMEGMMLAGKEKDDLEDFNNMSKEEQEKNIQEIVAKYKAMEMKDAR